MKEIEKHKNAKTDVPSSVGLSGRVDASSGKWTEFELLYFANASPRTYSQTVTQCWSSGSGRLSLVNHQPSTVGVERSRLVERRKEKKQWRIGRNNWRNRTETRHQYWWVSFVYMHTCMPDLGDVSAYSVSDLHTSVRFLRDGSSELVKE